MDCHVNVCCQKIARPPFTCCQATGRLSQFPKPAVIDLLLRMAKAEAVYYRVRLEALHSIAMVGAGCGVWV